MEEVEKKIIKELFEKAFNKHPHGSKDKAWAALQFHCKRKGKDSKAIGEQFILQKYIKYVELCKKEQKELKYIKYMEGFIEDAMYWGDYEYSDKHTTTLDRWLKGILKLLFWLP